MVNLERGLVLHLLFLFLCTCLGEDRYPKDEYRKAPPQRVFGAGIGIFLLVFFLIVACGMCWGGSLIPEERECQITWNIAGTLLFVLVSLLLLFAHEEPQYTSKETVTKGYRTNARGLLIVLILITTAAIFGTGAVCCYHVCLPVKAKVYQPYAIGDSSGIFDGRGRCIGKRPLLPV